MDTCVLPTSQHTRTVIFLHGRDSVASEFAEELLESQAADGRTLPQIFPETKWAFPTAPMLQSARFNKVEISQWFDIWETEDPHVREDEQKLDEQVKRIQKIIADEAETVEMDSVFLAGISQGCAIGIHALLTQPHQLAGFIGLCGWLPQERRLRASALPTAISTPVFLGHHEDDDVIKIKYGEELREQLISFGMQVSWHIYKDEEQTLKHWLNEPQGVDDIVRFIDKSVGDRDKELLHTTSQPPAFASQSP